MDEAFSRCVSTGMEKLVSVMWEPRGVTRRGITGSINKRVLDRHAMRPASVADRMPAAAG